MTKKSGDKEDKLTNHWRIVDHDKYIISLLSYFEKIKVGLWDHHAVHVSVYPP
jgi:hypothetical protein